MNKYVLQLLKKFAGIDIDELQAEFNRVQGENVKISTQLRHASDKISSMEKQISRLEAEATAYQTSVRENEEKHQKTMGEICLQNKELNSHIDEKDELIKLLQKDISDKEKALEDLQEKYNQLNNSLKVQQDSYEEKIKNLHQDTDTSLQQKEQNLLNARQDIQELQEKIRRTEAERDALSQTVSEKEEKLKTTETSLNEALIQIQKLDIRYKDSENQNKEAETELTTLRSNIQKLEQQLQQSEASLKGLNTRLDENESKNSQLAFQVEEYTSKNQELLSSLKEAQAYSQKLEKEIDQLKELQDQTETKGQVAENKLAQTLSANKELEAQINEAKEKLTGSENKLKSIAEELKHEQSKRLTAEKQQKETEDKLSSALREITILQETIKALEQEQTSPSAPSQKDTKNTLQELSEQYEYIRITTVRKSQHIFTTKNIHIKNGLFDWGVEGHELILDEEFYIPNEEISRIEGMKNPYSTPEITCDFSNEGNGPEVAETLLTAICCYHPVRITYKDKNGRISLRHLHYICFQPQTNSYSLPYKQMFQEMFSENLDTDHITAICAHHPEARTFIINQIQTIQVFDAFVTTPEGLETLKEGIQLATDNGQAELAEVLSGCIPA